MLLPLFITTLIISILGGAEVDLFIPSFPELQKVFSLSPFYVQFTLSVNFIAYCICSLFVGVLGDKYNRRYVMLISLAIFVFGSILCVIALNYPMLVIGRLLQGIGMAGPAVLVFAVISDRYPIQKQASVLGILAGATTFAMAFAPVIGSYVNLHFNWRGNFTILLLLGVTALVTSYFFIPNHKGDHSLSLSPKAYLPILRSNKARIFILTFCFLVSPYWVFIGMSPILYMQHLGVPLKLFGFYQGALALTFAITSLISPYILRKFGHKKSLEGGTLLCSLGGALIAWVTIFTTSNPKLITGILMLFSIGAVFPINILFPMALDAVKNSGGRASALITAGRLILVAFTLQIVSYFYNDTFLYIGLAMITLFIVSLLYLKVLIANKWLVFPPSPENQSFLAMKDNS